MRSESWVASGRRDAWRAPAAEVEREALERVLQLAVAVRLVTPEEGDVGARRVPRLQQRDGADSPQTGSSACPARIALGAYGESGVTSTMVRKSEAASAGAASESRAVSAARKRRRSACAAPADAESLAARMWPTDSRSWPASPATRALALGPRASSSCAIGGSSATDVAREILSRVRRSRARSPASPAASSADDLTQPRFRLDRVHAPPGAGRRRRRAAPVPAARSRAAAPADPPARMRSSGSVLPTETSSVSQVPSVSLGREHRIGERERGLALPATGQGQQPLAPRLRARRALQHRDASWGRPVILSARPGAAAPRCARTGSLLSATRANTTLRHGRDRPAGAGSVPARARPPR